MTGMLAISEGAIFGVGTAIFMAVFTAALSLAYLRFDEWGDDDEG